MNATLNFVRLRPQILLVSQKSLTFQGKKELDALRSVASLDLPKNVCQVTYSEIDPTLKLKDNNLLCIGI